jgi:hypothetical protein
VNDASTSCVLSWFDSAPSPLGVTGPFPETAVEAVDSIFLRMLVLSNGANTQVASVLVYVPGEFGSAWSSTIFGVVSVTNQLAEFILGLFD